MRKTKLTFTIQHLELLAIVVLCAFLLFKGGNARAAELFFNVETQKLVTGQEFRVDLRLNTDGDSVNAFEGNLIFAENLLAAREIRDGDSVVNFWIDRPIAGKDGRIHFSGIAPGGYQGSSGIIFSVIFQTKTHGDGVIDIDESRILRNDGKGTPARLKISPYRFSVSGEVSSATLAPIPDTELPETFLPVVGRDASVFEGRWFLAFATQDKGSGVDHYEVREGSRPYVRAESPYVLQNQKRSEEITVKAVDRKGNERIAQIAPLKIYAVYRALAILGILVAVIGIAFWYRRKKRK